MPHQLTKQFLASWLLTILIGLNGCDDYDRQTATAPPNDAAAVGAKSPGSADSTRSTDAESSQSNEVAKRPVPRPPQPEDWFEDVTEQSGVNFSFQNGRRSDGRFYILEGNGGGVAMLDYDRDGDLDLFCSGGGTISEPPVKIEGVPGALYRNDGDWKFVNVTEAAGLNVAGDFSGGCSVTDFDRDGFPDLFVACYGRSRLFRNNQEGGFDDVTSSAGLVVDGWSASAAWADVDRDGWPDLYVVSYVDFKPEATASTNTSTGGERRLAGPWDYHGTRDRLFRNRGDGSFEEITELAGLRDDGKGLAVLATDVNADGWIDFYIANDTTPNHLYLGGPDLKFQEVGLTSGTAFDAYGTPQGSMGVDVGDFNGDGRPDLWTTNYEREANSLYRNLGAAEFDLVSSTVGLGEVCRRFVGFGTGLVDFDSDGWLDVFVINGHVFYNSTGSSFRQPAFLFKNMDGKAFKDVTELGGPYFSIPHSGRGAAVGDLDNDGALDLVVSHQNEPITLLRNRSMPQNWVRVELRGTKAEPNAVGAEVSMKFQDRTLVRFVRSGAGYFSHFDSRIIFPADGEQPSIASVRWPNGRIEVFRGLKRNQTNELVEGATQRGRNE